MNGKSQFGEFEFETLSKEIDRNGGKLFFKERVRTIVKNRVGLLGGKDVSSGKEFTKISAAKSCRCSGRAVRVGVDDGK